MEFTFNLNLRMPDGSTAYVEVLALVRGEDVCLGFTTPISDRPDVLRVLADQYDAVEDRAWDEYLERKRETA